MIQSEPDTIDDSDKPFSILSMIEEDEIFEENIDEFDKEMDNDYDDGIAQSYIDDQLEIDHDDDMDDEDDDISPFGYNDELEDYDELEE